MHPHSLALLTKKDFLWPTQTRIWTCQLWAQNVSIPNAHATTEISCPRNYYTRPSCLQIRGPCAWIREAHGFERTDPFHFGRPMSLEVPSQASPWLNAILVVDFDVEEGPSRWPKLCLTNSSFGGVYPLDFWTRRSNTDVIQTCILLVLMCQVFYVPTRL